MRLLSCTIAITALSLFAVAELAVAWPVAWWLYAAAVATCATGLLRMEPLRRQAPRLCALTAFALIAAVLHVVDWTTRKPFLRDLARIQVGMTEAEVLAIMARYQEGTGWHFPAEGSRRQPAPELEIPGAIVFRHSDAAAFNSDWGIVSLRNGRVTAVEFSAD